MRCGGLPMSFVNKAFTMLTGYQRNAAEGRNCRFLQGKDTEDEALQAKSLQATR